MFKNWFEKIAKFLSENSHSIIDNTPHHSIKIECFSNNPWQKYEIVSWFDDHSISLHENSVKTELLQ